MIKKEKLANGVYCIKFNEIKDKTLLSYSEVLPKFEKINALKDLKQDILDEINVYCVGNTTVVTVPVEEEENLYGGGLNYKNMCINRKVLHLKMDHHTGVDNGRTHAPIPFYLSDKGYAVLINTTKYVDMYMGSANRTNSKKGFQNTDRNTDENWDPNPLGEFVEIAVNDCDALEILVFFGENLLDTVKRYNLYCGGGFIPPKWSLGIVQRVPTLLSDKEVMDTVLEFKERNFPLDVIGLEPGWQSEAYPCSYEWDKKRFSNPEKFLQDLSDHNIHVNLWENAFVSPNAKIFKELLPLSATHTVWGGIVPDYTLKKACDIYKNQHKTRHVDIGVSGYKIDECDGFDEWLWPDHAEFKNVNAVDYRSVLGVLLQKNTYEIFTVKNKRTFGLCRATNAGAVSFPYALYNDCYEFSDFLTGLCNAGFLGALWVPEARSAESAKEWLIRCQLVCFSPMAMINSWASGIKPWSFEEVCEDVKEAFKLRKSLLSYIYTAFYRYENEGIPPFRALCMDFESKIEFDEGGELHDTLNPYKTKKISEIKDQFMFGDSIMVAPFSPSDEKRKVVLPKEDWYDFYTGEFVGNDTAIYIDYNKKIPLFVKNGGIVPLNKESGGYEILHFGNKPSKFCVFEDDGVSFDYKNGKYKLINIEVSIENKIKKINVN